LQAEIKHQLFNVSKQLHLDTKEGKELTAISLQQSRQVFRVYNHHYIRHKKKLPRLNYRAL